jgi:hypothetical protein
VIAARRFGRGWLFPPLRPAADTAPAELFGFFPKGEPLALSLPGDAAPLALRHVPASARMLLSLPPEAEEVTILVDGQPQQLALEPAAGQAFAGRNVLLAQRNGEPASQVADFLVWHAAHHGADAAIILDRARPDAGDLAAELGALLAADPRGAAMAEVLVLRFDLPLGRPDEGPESHPLYAPDAPGRDRMEAPAPDPWSARLGFPLLYDMIRARHLSEAAAVARLEVMDLVQAAPDGQTLFARCQAEAGGVLPLSGERVYPWAIRDGEITLGDHICNRFDGTDRANSWCCVPSRLPAQAMWMPHRILGASGTPSASAAFWRCMALRHGEEGKVSRIVARTALQQRPELQAMAGFFGRTPEAVPREQANAERLLPVREVTGQRTAIVTTMKNEGPFILEWLAYHRAIGVSDFLVYTNDCTDGTDDFLRLLMRKGLVQWRENPYRESGMKPQHAALDHANTEAVIRGADWAICMDVDEFIAVHVGDHTLPALFAAVPDANLISLTWRLFGNADVHEYRDEFITQTYFLAAREQANKPHQAWGFKTLFKNMGLFKKLGVHRPKGIRPGAAERISWVNGSGRDMPQSEWRNAWRSTSVTYGYDLVALNHYAVRSAESFLVKRDRGRVNHVDRDQGMAYWFRMNHNVVEDRRMEKLRPKLQAEWDRLMCDPEIAAMHHACVAAHRAKIAELRAQPAHDTFYAELTSPRTAALSRLHGHFGSNVYLAGPAVIPDEIAARQPQDDFFFTVEHVDETQH